MNSRSLSDRLSTASNLVIQIGIDISDDISVSTPYVQTNFIRN